MLILFLDKSKSSSPGVEEGNSPRTFGTPDVWRKYRIDPIKVNQWIANLRMVILIEMKKNMINLK